MKETVARSIAKTISWRIIATLTTMIVVWLLTGDVTAALAVGGINVIVKMIFYFIHERAWNHVMWGKKKKNA